MVAINLEGDTLGRRHKHYNKLLKEALDNNPPLEKIQPTDNDINNLFRIDIACRKHDVEYVMEVLKSDDMLYVSRAIKRSPWLIRDSKYADIINPEHLHDVVFPHMTSKAISKLLLNIRLNLKDEIRAEKFYKYYKDKDINIAMKWLPLCSEAVIVKEVESLESLNNIDAVPIFKRLCEKSFKVLEIFIRKISYGGYNYIKCAMFLLNENTAKFLDIFETIESYQRPDLSPKFTNIIMKKCPERILDKFETYYKIIDLETFARYFKNADVKAFLLKQLANKKIHSNWFKFENVKYFVRYIPKDGRFDFLKKVFIEKTYKSEQDEEDEGGNVSAKLMQCSFAMSLCASSKRCITPSSSNIYRWYRYAPFEIAFVDLKKLIRTESNPAERNAMLNVLILSATPSLNNIQIVLQYYHDKHMNEPLNHKIQFVNNIISKSDTHKYDEKTWHLLNNIFCSMGVYIESDTNVEKCIQAIIVYKVIHYEKVPDIIEKKFSFDTLKSIRVKLSKPEQERVFEYLYNTILLQLHNKEIQNNTDFNDAINLMDSVLNLLMDWDKHLNDYPLLTNKIKSFIKTKATNSWKTDLSCLYNKHKSWKKHLFEHSIALLANEEVCINALKHDADLLTRYFDVVQALCVDDRVSLYKLLGKIRLYWPESLYGNWVGAYQKWLSEPRPTGHAAVVRGLCTLIPRHIILDLARQYVPTDTKITYTEEDNSQLNVTKQFAMNLHLVRPMASPDIVLLFAKGDYLQYAMPSLSSVMYTISPINSKEFISKILNAPVSLQKHGIRLAFTKLNFEELKEIFSQTWQKTKNSSIRAVLFKKTFELMCREKNDTNAEEIFSLISEFVKKISAEEDKIIYSTLGEVVKVPKCVKAKYFMMGYNFLKSLPAKANCDDIINRLLNYSTIIMEDLDSDFVADVLLGCNDKTKLKSYNLEILSTYIMCARDEKSQTQRYEKVLVDWLNYTCSQWSENLNSNYNARYNLKVFLEKICCNIQEYVFKKNMVLPVKLFEDISSNIEKKLSVIYNYSLFRFIKLAIAFMKLLDQQRSLINEVTSRPVVSQASTCSYHDVYEKVYLKVVQDYSLVCAKVLHQDVTAYFLSVYILLAKVMTDVLDCFTTNDTVRLTLLKNILDRNVNVECYLFAIEAMSHCNEEVKPLQTAIFKMITAHKSSEVKMHFYNKFGSDLEHE